MGFLKFFLHPLFIHLLGLHLVHPHTRGAISLRSSSRADFVGTITEEMRKPFVITHSNKLLDFVNKFSPFIPKFCLVPLFPPRARRRLHCPGGGAPVNFGRRRRRAGLKKSA